MRKQPFRIIHVARYEVSMFREKASKMKGPRGPQMAPKSGFGCWGLAFGFWGGLLGGLISDAFLIGKKNRRKLEKSTQR